jgi:hypothetical protein
MGPLMVIVFCPLPKDNLGLPKTVEDFSIQQTVSEGAIKAFTKAILSERVWGDLGRFDSNRC